MNGSVAFRFRHSPGCAAVIERREDDKFRVALFDTSDCIETCEAIQTDGEMFPMIFHDTEG